MKQLLSVVLCLSLFIIACTHEKANVPPQAPQDTLVALTPYEIEPPPHFPELIIPPDNMPAVEKIALGRKLYYDPILSNDGRSCSSCHLQSQGFTIDRTLNDVLVLPHVNLGWYNNFMWDGSQVGTMEDVMLYEVRDFFGTDLNKINNNATYRSLFKKYFDADRITYKELSYALSQFMRTMVSKDSKYDRYIKGQVKLSYDEMQGRNLFFTEKGDCFHCHVNPITTDNLFHNTGLDSIYIKPSDKGLYNVTGKFSDLGRFRTPNLRNVALRKKFMHDGRFSSLEEVIEFYNSGVNKVPNIDPIMTKPHKEHGLQLSVQEKYQLVQFLNTFTDYSFISDTSFSAPAF